LGCDKLLTVFQVSFIVGISLIILSFLFGSLFEALEFDGFEFDLEVFGLDINLPLSPLLYMLFATVFGGMGWILMLEFQYISNIIVLLISIITALVVSMVIYRFIMKPLKNAENTSSPSSEDLIGLRAVVASTIVEDGFGEIRYVFNGNSFSAPAKSTDGSMIKAGREVSICWIENHIFYVAALDEIKTGL